MAGKIQTSEWTPTLSGVKQMLEVFPEMVKKMNFKYYKYDAKQRINMLANTVRQFVGRHKDSIVSTD